jgi:hypothetical protein
MIIRSPILDFFLFFFFFFFKSNTVRSISSARGFFSIFLIPRDQIAFYSGLFLAIEFFFFVGFTDLSHNSPRSNTPSVPRLSRRWCSATDAFKSPWPFHGWRQIFNSAYKFHDFLFLVFSFGAVDQLKGVKQKRKWSSNRSKTGGQKTMTLGWWAKTK